MARNDQQQRREPKRDLAIVHPPRLPYPVQAQKAGIEQSQWKALTDAIFPAAKSVDGVMLAIDYCRARKLDIFKRVVHVVPMWNSTLGEEVDTVWPGVGELRTTASRTTQYAGNDECVFGPPKTQSFEAVKERPARGQQQASTQRAQCPQFTFPEWAQITVYKMVQGQRVAFVGPRVRFTETFSGTKGLRVPNDRWQLAPYQMLEKCAEAAALRRAFPEELGDEWTAEEMEGKETIEGSFTVVTDPPAGEKDEGKPKPRDRTKKWSDDVDQALRTIQEKIDLTHKPEPLVGAMRDTIQGRTAVGWNKAALADLERRFMDRIAALVGDDEAWYAKHFPPAGAQGGGEGTAGPAKPADFLASYCGRLADLLGNAPDLNSYNSGEKDALAALDEEQRAVADKAFAIAMQITKEEGCRAEFIEQLSAIEGAPAVPAGTPEPAGEEEQ